MEINVGKRYLIEFTGSGILDVVVDQKTESGMFVHINGCGFSKWMRTAAFVDIVLEEFLPGEER